MYVNSGGAGAGDCEGAAALEPNCANDQPVAKLLRSSLERLLIKYEVSEPIQSGANPTLASLSVCTLVQYLEG